MIYETTGGFTLGEISPSANGQTMMVCFKNEKMACFLDGTVCVTVPDFICVFDEETGARVANIDVLTGQRIAEVLLSAHAPFPSHHG